jgi:hypothetical protein
MFLFRLSDGTAGGPYQYQKYRRYMEKSAHKISSPSSLSISQSSYGAIRPEKCASHTPKECESSPHAGPRLQ